MTFRSNTMATKAVESYIKLVGKEYLHGLLHRYIQRVLACSDTWEVDPDKLPTSSLASGSLLSADGQGTAPAAAAIIRDYCAHKASPIRSSSTAGSGCNALDTPQHSLTHLAVLSNGRLAQPGSLIFSQLKLLQHLDLVWETVRASRKDFPKQLLQVFSAFRAALQPSRGAEFCDKLVSACIFLRFICPAILTPSLFGLASTFPGEFNCQRNLTLVAKSLQSLANLATFGDKEPFMRFMNAYVEAQIPVMRAFLRGISSLDITADAPADCTSASLLSNHIDCGYELACLHATCVEMFANLAAKDTKPPEGRRLENGSSQTSSSVSCRVSTVCYLCC
ncbi:unnamed protein product [Schistocephalus solidus]|uniref:Ras-GAP domain-containing protein n=1 Tax=Schistocephalus solidus TaxID=70667 RepID=A0A183T7Y4_SCHSO|nr:unnamed protein product [Schistocephalus solidus]